MPFTRTVPLVRATGHVALLESPRWAARRESYLRVLGAHAKPRTPLPHSPSHRDKVCCRYTSMLQVFLVTRAHLRRRISGAAAFPADRLDLGLKGSQKACHAITANDVRAPTGIWVVLSLR